MKLLERAELMSYDDLERISSIRPAFEKRLEECILERAYGNKFFLLGPKGSGKTFSMLKALIESVKEGRVIKPFLMTYKYAGRPFTIKVRQGGFVFGEDFWRLMESENVIVLDDLHYICEDIVKGRRSLRWFCSLIEHADLEAEAGKKVFLMSEDFIGYYAGLIKSEELEWISNKIRREYQLMELLPPTLAEWDQLVEIYNVRLTPFAMKFIYATSPKPRAFLKFCKIFGDVVDIPSLRKVALRRLSSMKMNPKERER